MHSNNNLSFYKQNSWIIVKLFICIIFSIVLLIYDRNYLINKYISSSFSTLLSPIAYIANKPIELVTYLAKYFENQKLLIKQYEEITQNYTIKSIKLDVLNDIEKKYNELQTIFQLQNINHNITVAKILPNKNIVQYKISINKGGNNNIKLGQAVATIDGFIGQITSVSPTTSQVTLLNTSKIIIPAKIARTGLKVLLYEKYNKLEIPYFPADEDLQKNDLIVTSGVDNNFPAGIPVAKIFKIKKLISSAPYLSITAKPTAKIDNKDYVIIFPLNN